MVFVALGRDLECEMVQCGAGRLMAVKSRSREGMSSIIDQGQQLRVAMPAKWRVEWLDRKKRDRRLAERIGLGTGFVASFAQNLEAENLLIELPHSWQISDAQNNLGDPGDGRNSAHDSIRMCRVTVLQKVLLARLNLDGLTSRNTL